MNIVRVFCSYAESDKAYYDELSTHLAALRRSECIETWSQVQISVGEDRKDRVAKELEGADVFLFLISANFIECTSCFEDQMLRALELAEAGQIIAIPLLVRACDWHYMPFASLSMLPSDRRPLASRTPPERDEAWADIAGTIRAMLGRNIPWRQPRQAQLPTKLDDLLGEFLCEWSRWGFNVARIRNWGGRQPGFEMLGRASIDEIQGALRRLTSAKVIATFTSKTGSQLYRVV